MTAPHLLPNDEIPEAMEMEISRAWQHVQAASDDQIEAALQDAAASLYAARKVNYGFYPESDAAVEQAIDKELPNMAHHLCIARADAEQIFTKAKRQGPSSKAMRASPKLVNGHTASIEPPTPSPEDYGTIVPFADQISAQPAPPLAWIDFSNWDSERVPDRQWAIRDRVPLKQAGLFSGRGRHRQINHRAYEERRACHRQGLAAFHARARARILYRRRGRRRRTPHPACCNRRALWHDI